MESLEGKIAQDKDYYTAIHNAREILHWLNDFIPSYCHRDAERCIAEILMKGEFELTSKSMRKEYEAWKALTLRASAPSSHSVKPE